MRKTVDANVQVYGDVNGVLSATDVRGSVHVDHAVRAGDGPEMLAYGRGVGSRQRPVSPSTPRVTVQVASIAS